MRLFLLSFVCFSSLFGESFVQPEAMSDWLDKEPVYGQKVMVAAANPFASQAGLSILEKGGNALDAAIAMQMVLNVVEPQSSGIGGGAFLLYYSKKDGKVFAYDGREVAPQEVEETLFLDEQGKPIEASEAMTGGRSVGVPGLLRMLEIAHQERGALPWASLFQEAIAIAEAGFPISPRLHHLMEVTPKLPPITKARMGEIWKNPELGATFRLIAEQGSAPFYEGEIAEEIVQAVRKGAHPGGLSLQDLARYQPLKRDPLITTYRHFRIVGFPPPGGGIVVAQILGMLEKKKLKQLNLNSPAFINLFCGASRLAFADRNHYMADPDFFPTPIKRLVDPRYLKKRSQELVSFKALPEAKRGTWPGQSVSCCPPLLTSTAYEFPSTSQICVVDGDGNAVSMTSSIENAFGSRLFVRGFFLNNELTDFSFLPEKEGVRAANRIEPGKRPVSAMAPTLVFDQRSGDLVLSVGSAGGKAIVDYVAQGIIGVLDFGLNIQEAISSPHYIAIKRTLRLEKGTTVEASAHELEEMGNHVEIASLSSGTQGIELRSGGVIGGVDPRREGKALTLDERDRGQPVFSN